MKMVQILMSTYNGEKFLREQLDSILNQDYRDISLLIRDDGSTDSTDTIIHEYISKDSRITYYKGENVGVRNSFFDLMKHADLTMDYYALSDQDDVWMVNKVSKAVEMLQGIEGLPALYASETQLVEENLNKIKTQIHRPQIIPCFGNALVENICTGCTCLFNRELLVLVKEHIPEYTVMHDWWLYLSASAFGRVVYDMRSYILYRQHGNNIVGTKATYLDEFKGRLSRYKGNRGNIRNQLEEFDIIYQLDIPQKELLNKILTYKDSIKEKLEMISCHRIYRQRRMDNLILKVLFIFNEI